MSITKFGDLPATLQAVQTRPLFVIRLDVEGPTTVGQTPAGHRRIGVIHGGSFEGDRLSGVVLDGGSDWQIVRDDRTTTLDVRLLLKTEDGERICMTYRGLRHGPDDVIAKLGKGEPVDPASYYFRINPTFETESAKYDWINRILTIGIGHRFPDGPIYSVFEIL